VTFFRPNFRCCDVTIEQYPIRAFLRINHIKQQSVRNIPLFPVGQPDCRCFAIEFKHNAVNFAPAAAFVTDRIPNPERITLDFRVRPGTMDTGIRALKIDHVKWQAPYLFIVIAPDQSAGALNSDDAA